ncbi:MAG: glycosyltransferase [Patescibacteria group bacterium]
MPRVLITVPANNEATVIEQNLGLLSEMCAKTFAHVDWMIEVAENGSTDATSAIVERVASLNPRVRLLRVQGRGKGQAIIASWRASAEAADVFLFTDADLAAGIDRMQDLFASVISGGMDAACGSRYVAGASIDRSCLRSLVSRTYRTWQKCVLHLPVHDAQCGLKAVSPRVVREILPHLEERTWLFDSELLAHVHARGWHIAEMPVTWVEHRDHRRRSTVRLWRDAWAFIFGVYRIRQRVKNVTQEVQEKNLSTVFH